MKSLDRNISVSYDSFLKQKWCRMMNHISVVTRYIDELNDIGGLSGTDIANIAEVSKATVSRWKSGSIKPHPRTQLVLSDLYYVVDRLREYYTSDEIRTWLYARHPQLDGARAVDRINQNKSEDILRILDRLDSEVYV